MAVRKMRNGKAARRSTPLKKKRALRPRSDAPSAISLLKNDHRDVDALFSQFEKTTGAARKQTIVQKICDALTVHATIEEDIFYPQARDALILDDRYQRHLAQPRFEHLGAARRRRVAEKLDPSRAPLSGKTVDERRRVQIGRSRDPHRLMHG